MKKVSLSCVLSTGRYSVTRTSNNTLVVQEYAQTHIGAYYTAFKILVVRAPRTTKEVAG